MVERPDSVSAAAAARLYDLDLAEDPGDLDLYLAVARRTGGPVLELAVGTGRLAVPLAEAGYEVTGVDVDPAMLDRARTRLGRAAKAAARRLRLVEADIDGLRLPDAGRYRLAILALNSLMLLATRGRQAAAIRTMADHLRPGGVAVVDVWLPDAEDLARFDGRLVLEYARPDPVTGRLVTKVAAARHDAASGTVDLVAIHEEGNQGEGAARWVRRDQLRLVSADELRGFAEAAGLAVEQLAGNYDLGPLGAGGERAILIATKS